MTELGVDVKPQSDQDNQIMYIEKQKKDLMVKAAAESLTRAEFLRPKTILVLFI